MSEHDLIIYNGNEKEFESYRIELEYPIKGKIIYYENTKWKKYEGGLLNSLYEGLGILYTYSYYNSI